jgi:hypothetical protein
VKETRVGLGLSVTHAAKALCGAARTEVPTPLINASDPSSHRVLIVFSLKPDPRLPITRPSSFAVEPRQGLRLQVRFTGGF